MNIRSLLIIAICLFISTQTFSQRPGRMMPQGSISGTVHDSQLNVPLEYVTVIAFSQRDSSQIKGIITDSNGAFQLLEMRPGIYYVEFSFMGYERKIISDIFLGRGAMSVDIGEVKLDPAAIDMDEVEVALEKLPIEFKIDKKVINVDQHYTAASGTAVDVLENVPSVSVDIEGNVKMRGSGNFTLLIDGKPSMLDPSDALQQIPSSTIDNIELITNPSVKYDPEGRSGIMNVVLKKNQLRGISGIVNLNAGLDEKYGGDALISSKNGKTGFNIGVNYRNMMYPGSFEEENRTIYNGVTSNVYSDGSSERLRAGYGLNGGIDYQLTNNDDIGFGFRYGDRRGERNNELDFDEWDSSSPTNHAYYSSLSESERSGYYYMGFLNYTHRFPRKNHKLSGKIYRGYRNMDEKSVSELVDVNNVLSSGQKSTEEGPGQRIGVEIDYTHSFNDKNKFEAGYNNRIRMSEEATTYAEYDTLTGLYSSDPQFSHDIEYRRDVHALYSLYAGEIGSFGYQGGLRGEYTYRIIEVTDTGESFNIDRWNYFPSTHFSYRLDGGQQLMASYSRRIDRPRGWYLEPFQTWTDAYNVREGNPSLKPEFIDSYEIGFQANLGRNLFSTELYYRQTDNVIERIRTVYAENVTLHSTDNVGTSQALGLETMLDMDVRRWWNVNLNGNLFQYEIKGTIFGEDFSNDNFSWKVRLNNMLKIGNTTRLQVNVHYSSPSVSSQGTVEGFFTTNLAVKQEFFDRKMSATLQLKNVFQTAGHEFVNEGADFYSYTYFAPKAPVVLLNLSFNINNYKPERRQNGEMNDMDNGEEL